MTMIDSLSSISKYDSFDGGAGSRPIWGKVISNKDPKMLGRIKVEIKDLMPFDDKIQLPWVYPLYPAGLGQGPLTTNFSVPEEQSFVACIFPDATIYAGYYVYSRADRLRRPVDFLSEYPERYGTMDSRENKKIVNKDPEIDSIEYRFADSAVTVWDSKHHLISFKDQFGTRIEINREKQTLHLEFGGIKIWIEDGEFKMEGVHQKSLFTSSIQLIAEEILKIKSGTVMTYGDVISHFAKVFHDDKPGTMEGLDRETRSTKTDITAQPYKIPD